VIDLHCHLLPGIDDGPADLDGTLALARAQVDAGVRAVACTPHVNWRFDLDAATIAAARDAAAAALAAAGIELELLAGAEVGLTRAVELDDASLAALRLGGGEWLLLEAPLEVAASVEQAIRAVAARGHRVLLAHPERCPAFQRDPDALRRLVDDDVVRCQLTASALTGAYGGSVQRLALRLLDDGLAHVVASDAHDAIGRPPGLREHLERAGRGELVEWVTELVPGAIAAGTPLPGAPPPSLAPRRWWQRN
jgi:protein-tyrosine phosphatase